VPEILRVGGKQYNWNSSISRVDGQPWRGITSIDWSQKLDVETVYAQTQDGVPLGDTGGQYSVDSFTIKMLREYWEQLKLYLATLAPGVPLGSRGLPGSWGQTKFTFQMSVSEPLEIGALPIQLDASPCRVIGEKAVTEKVSASLETELSLWCRQLKVNGLTMYSPALPTL
jgi:hypothetical protein